MSPERFDPDECQRLIEATTRQTSLHGDHVRLRDYLAAHAAALCAEVRELRKLETYMGHQMDCKELPGWRECDCGFQDRLDALHALRTIDASGGKS